MEIHVKLGGTLVIRGLVEFGNMLTMAMFEGRTRKEASGETTEKAGKQDTRRD